MGINTIGEKIKEARERANMSQLELAKALEINEKTLRGYEKGNDINIGLAKKISETLSVDFYWLINLSGDSNLVNNSQSTITNEHGTIFNLSGVQDCDINHSSTVKPTNKSQITMNTEEELTELCSLIKDYATPKYRMEIKEKLLRFKELH